MEIDPKTGKYKLSHRVLMEKPEGYVERERRPRPERGERRGRRRSLIDRQRVRRVDRGLLDGGSHRSEDPRHRAGNRHGGGHEGQALTAQRRLR